MASPGAESLIAAAYAAFLVVASLILDRAARHSHHRSTRYRTAGFRFVEAVDAWICPQDEYLRRVDTDHVRRVATYRAPASVCNSCAVKEECTDSDEGRSVVRALDPWPHSEAGRFHRGIALVLLALAELVVVVALVRNHASGDLVLLAPLAAGIAAGGVRAAEAFRRLPASFGPAEPGGA